MAFMRFMLAFLVFLLPSAAKAEENCVLSSSSGVCVDRAVYAEADVTIAGALALIRVHVINGGKENRKLLTGRAGESVRGGFGGPYDLDTYTDAQTGAGELAAPVLTFGGLTLTAPRPPSFGHTLRNMAPTILTLAPGEKKHYCSFSVPAQHVSGKFLHGVISFPAAYGAKSPFVIIDVRKAVIRAAGSP